MDALGIEVARTEPPTSLRSDSHPVLTDVLLHTPLDGHRLRGQTLAELVCDQTTLLVFLRHFG